MSQVGLHIAMSSLSLWRERDWIYFGWPRQCLLSRRTLWWNMSKVTDTRNDIYILPRGHLLIVVWPLGWNYVWTLIGHDENARARWVRASTNDLFLCISSRTRKTSLIQKRDFFPVPFSFRFKSTARVRVLRFSRQPVQSYMYTTQLSLRFTKALRERGRTGHMIKDIYCLQMQGTVVV